MSDRQQNQGSLESTDAARLERYAVANSTIEATHAGELEAGTDKAGVASRTRRIALHEHDPIYWTNIVYTVYESGDWKITCNVENRSGHSDWDVWLTLWIKSSTSNANVCTFAENVCFQDLDSGENYNREGSGFSSCIRDNWAQIANGNFYQTFTSTKRRDN